MPDEWVTKDSGKRVDYESGMRRDTQEGKPRFDLLFVEGMPAGEQFIGRMAGLLQRGAEKYGERNWQLANSEEELSRFRASAARHFSQWLAGEDDEDHAAAAAVNLLFLTYVEWKLKNAKTPEPDPEPEQLSADSISEPEPAPNVDWETIRKYAERSSYAYHAQHQVWCPAYTFPWLYSYKCSCGGGYKIFSTV